MGGLILLLAIGEGFNPARLKARDLGLSLPFLVAWVGLWVGWRWEGLGGILVVAGVAGFYLLHFALTGFGQFPRGWAFPVLALPGLLFLACWFLRKKATAAATS
jgi:hypothetical protein